MTIATCPRCSTKALIFVRDGAWTPEVDNLVCLDCSTVGK